MAISTVIELDSILQTDLLDLCLGRRGSESCAVVLDGGEFSAGEAWTSLAALDARLAIRWSRWDDSDAGEVLERLDLLVRGRRLRGGTPATGVLVAVGFNLFGPRAPEPEERLPDLVAIEVEASISFPRDAAPVFTGVSGSSFDWSVARASGAAVGTPREPLRAVGPPTTSLERSAYLRAVDNVHAHIRAGDIYQANLTQRFAVPVEGDALELFRRLTRSAAAPKMAFVETPELAIVSVSPETFLRVDPGGTIETWPIKGTRPRGENAAIDEALARELLASEKDRAELTMIVDLERNDLGRVCRTGTVEVPRLCSLRSFPAVHHLVGHVRGRVLPETGPADWLRAAFPGGSVTGAPKLRALEILHELEPLPRNFYTGSLLWFGDDGSLDSSILIRTVVVSEGTAYLGAGGGVVADSEPESEWEEANHKARPLARELGFEPEQAT